LNQERFGSSSGIHSLIACQGGSIGSKVLLLISDGVLGFWRNVVDDGGEKIGGFDDLEVALGGVMAFGAAGGESC
jgi:hypothetical protein